MELRSRSFQNSIFTPTSFFGVNFENGIKWHDIFGWDTPDLACTLALMVTYEGKKLNYLNKVVVHIKNSSKNH